MKAPKTAMGLSGTCPECFASFTLIDSGLPLESPAQKQKASKRRRVLEPTPLPDDMPVLRNETAIKELTPLETPAAPALVAAPYNVTQRFRTRADAESETRMAFVLGLVALIIAGIALGVSQVPYGRFITLVLSLIGVIFAVVGVLVAESGRLLPSIGLGANAVAFVLVTLLPSWLNLKSWWPEVVDPTIDKIKQMPFNGDPGSIIDDGWVDSSKGAWQLDDVRVTVTASYLGKIELLGPKQKRLLSKEPALVLGLHIANVGAARKIDYKSWNEPVLPDQPTMRIFDSTTKEYKAKKFDPEWQHTFKGGSKSLFPGHGCDDYFVLEAFEIAPDYIRLELPSAAIGRPAAAPIRIHIPKSSIQLTNQIGQFRNPEKR